MVEREYRGSISALPSNGLLTFEGKAGDDQGIELGSAGSDTACKSNIKGQREENRIVKYRKSFDFDKTADCNYFIRNQEGRKDYRKNELLKIYEGVVFARKIKMHSWENKGEIKKASGEKKEITTFSKRSRLNMIKHLAMMKIRPVFWYDLTYPDDVMEGLSHEERKLKSSEDMHQLKRWVEREGIKAQGIWKREWKLRKSGIIKGSAVPHFHNVDWIENTDDSKYLQIYYRMVEKWLKIIGTKGEYEAAARKVHYHKKSFRFIKSQKQMRKYMQKYISKDEEFISSESIGRSWGLIGDPIEKNPEEIEITNNEMVLLKRMLRKFCKGINKKVKYGLNFCLSNPLTQFFVLMERQTVYMMLEHIRAGTVVEGVPF